MHYVDEGPRGGRPVVLVHGNPTWGFLYRNFIGPLTDAGHRAIVPDHLGFGRSDKPTDPEFYRIPRHVARLEALLESLDLRDAVVVAQDWGGPIGLSWAVAHPERVSGLFILDTFAGWRQNFPVPLRLFRTPGVGEVLWHPLHWVGVTFATLLLRQRRQAPPIAPPGLRVLTSRRKRRTLSPRIVKNVS